MTIEELRDELMDPNGPLYSVLQPLVVSREDEAIANVLNQPRTEYPQPRDRIPRGELLEVLAGTGGLQAIYAAATDVTSPAFNLAKAAVLILEDANGELDYTRPGTQQLVSAIGPAGYGILNETQLTALIAVCQRPGSRAEYLWGRGVRVTANMVSQALN